MPELSTRVVFLGDTSSAVRSLRTLEGSTNSLSRAIRLVRTAAITGLVGGLGLAIAKAGEFEKVLNVLQATTGANQRQMEAFRKKARDLGNDLKLPATSAKDAADAMLELSKGGLSVRDTLDASRAVLELSTAAQIDNAEAAKITARALNAFGLSGRQAGKVADVLANAANKSTGEISDFALGLQQSSAVAKAYGLSIQQTTGMLARFADAGIVGSDAGTMLKRVLQTLEPTSDKAAALMEKYGLHTINAKDGSLKLSETIDLFHKRLAAIDPVQRRQIINQLAGSDAARGWNILFSDSAKVTDAYTRAMNQNGTAHRIAEAQTKGFAGALEGFKSVMETLLIDVGTKLLPMATRGVREFSQEIQDVGPEIADFAGDAARQFREFEGELRTGLSVGQDFARFLTSDLGLALAGGALSMRVFVGGAMKARAAMLALKAIEFTPAMRAITLLGGAIGIASGAFIHGRLSASRYEKAVDGARGAVNQLRGALEKQVTTKLDLKEARLQMADLKADTKELIARRAELRRQLAGEKDPTKRADLTREISGLTRDIERVFIDRARTQQRIDKLVQDTKKNAVESRQALGSVATKANALFKSVQDLGRVGSLRVFDPQSIPADKLKSYTKEARNLAEQAKSVGDKYRNSNPAIARQARLLAEQLRTSSDLTKKLGVLTQSRHDVNVRVSLSFDTTGGVFGPSSAFGPGQGGPRITGPGARARTGPGNDGFIGADSVLTGLIGDGVVGIAQREAQKLSFGNAANPGGLVPQVLDDLAMAQVFGLSLMSGYRAGSITSTGRKSLHSVGKAIDVAGSPAAMRAYAMAARGRPGIRELLYSPLGGSYGGSAWSPLSGSVLRDHYSHVHVGVYAGGGIVPLNMGTPGRDSVPAILTPGEMVLNEGQMEMLGGRSLLARMFGFAGDGGPGFAAGGIVGKRPPKRAPKQKKLRSVRKRFSKVRTGEAKVDALQGEIDELDEQIRRDTASYNLSVDQFGLDDSDEIIKTRIGPDGEEVEYVDTGAQGREAGQVQQLIALQRGIQAKVAKLRNTLTALVKAIRAAIANLKRAIRETQAQIKRESATITGLRGGLPELRTDLAKLERKRKPTKADKERMADLRKMIREREGQIKLHEGRRDSLGTAASTFGARLGLLGDPHEAFKGRLFDEDLEWRRIESVDIPKLSKDLADIQGKAPRIRPGGGGGVTEIAPDLAEEIRRLQEQLGHYRLALGIQNVQLPIIGSFSSGSIHVPQTGLALVHAGERIERAGTPNVNVNTEAPIVNVYVEGDVAPLLEGKIRVQIENWERDLGHRANIRAREGRY